MRNSVLMRFLLLSLRVCSKRKKCVYYTTAKLSSEKLKHSLFPKKKSLVGSTPGFFAELLKMHIKQQLSRDSDMKKIIVNRYYKHMAETLKIFYCQ